MYRRNARSDRRSTDGLYQADHHRWLKDRAKGAAEARRRLTLKELQERAEEARRHDCEHTHVHPEVLLELLQIRARLLLMVELVAKHREMAEQGLPNGDAMLWANVLGLFNRQKK